MRWLGARCATGPSKLFSLLGFKSAGVADPVEKSARRHVPLERDGTNSSACRPFGILALSGDTRYCL
jgi:hypothetical protein